MHFSRRRKGITNYRKRLALLKSGIPRAVVRFSNAKVSVQIIDFAKEGDKVLASANSNDVAVSWFTVSEGKPAVNLAFSEFYGSSFGDPIKINDHSAIGRVDIAFLNDEEVLISYMEGDDFGTYLRIKKVSINGKVSEPITISKIDSGRNTGVPQLEILNNEIFIVWTVFENEKNQLKTVKLSSKDI